MAEYWFIWPGKYCVTGCAVQPPKWLTRLAPMIPYNSPSQPNSPVTSYSTSAVAPDPMPGCETTARLDDVPPAAPEGPSNGLPEDGGTVFRFGGLSTLLPNASDPRE